MMIVTPKSGSFAKVSSRSYSVTEELLSRRCERERAWGTSPSRPLQVQVDGLRLPIVRLETSFRSSVNARRRRRTKPSAVWPDLVMASHLSLLREDTADQSEGVLW